MIILSIDPGTSRRNPAGLVVIDTSGPEPELLHAQTVYGSSWQAAVRNIYAAGCAQAFAYCIEAVAYEYPFLGEFENANGETASNAQTAIKLAHIGGVALAIAAAYDVPAALVYPVEAKLALCRDPQASKQAMIKMARLVFGRRLGSHEADACGIGLAGETKLREGKILQLHPQPPNGPAEAG